MIASAFGLRSPAATPVAITRSIGNVKVPTYLYKLVYDATTHRAWAHWQANREGERVSAPISYQELVKRTGIEFLPKGAPLH